MLMMASTVKNCFDRFTKGKSAVAKEFRLSLVSSLFFSPLASSAASGEGWEGRVG